MYRLLLVFLLFVFAAFMQSCSSSKSFSDKNGIVLDVMAEKPAVIYNNSKKSVEVVEAEPFAVQVNRPDFFLAPAPPVLPKEDYLNQKSAVAPGLVLRKKILLNRKEPERKVHINEGNEDEPKTERMAVASFILGILSVILSPLLVFLVLPIVVLSIVYALRSIDKINASEGKLKGKGLAITGFILAGLGLVTILTAGIVTLWILIFFW